VADGSVWKEKARRIVRAEMARRGLTYAELAVKLREIGVEEDERTLRLKVGRGMFSAVFLLQVMAAIGCETLQLR